MASSYLRKLAARGRNRKVNVARKQKEAERSHQTDKKDEKTTFGKELKMPKCLRW